VIIFFAGQGKEKLRKILCTSESNLCLTATGMSQKSLKSVVWNPKRKWIDGFPGGGGGALGASQSNQRELP
jgi:hypothetical protein